MKKDFDGWNRAKQHIEEYIPSVYSNPKEIWWCSLGLNIGAEVDGGDSEFERPVLVMKVYNKETLVVLPLTKRKNNDLFHHKIKFSGEEGWVKLTQARVISSKRLRRTIGVLDGESFAEVLAMWKKYL